MDTGGVATPDNVSFDRALGASGGSPGSGAENGAVGGGGGSSEPLSGSVRRELVASRIAARQKTLVTIEQLVVCGLGDDAVAYRLGAGRLCVVFRGVYSWGCGELPSLGREHEGLWVSSPARAVLEVAAVGTKDELVEVIDQGLALRLFNPG